MKNYQQIRQRLVDNADENYKLFHQKLKAEGIGHFYGVRVPILRTIAKEISQNDPLSFIKQINFDSYEEKVLYGMVVAKLKIDFKEKLNYLALFIEQIDSWAVCDVVGFKVTKKEKPAMWAFLSPYFASDQEFALRFAIVNTMTNFLDDEYIDRVLDIYQSINSNYYYVNMAVAWAIQVAFIKQPEKTQQLFEKQTLSTEIVNKAIQKIRDSRRVSLADKERILNYRRK